MSDIEQAVLQRFKQRVQRRFSLYKMILIGSRAKGVATPESDMDVIVILEKPVSEEAADYVSECAWEAGFEDGIVVAPLTFGRHEWEEGPERHSLLARAAETEGIPV